MGTAVRAATLVAPRRYELGEYPPPDPAPGSIAPDSMKVVIEPWS
jgi:hypothetical protein